jgi:hypothetical protein
MTDNCPSREERDLAVGESCDECLFCDNVLAPDELRLVPICWRKSGRATWHTCPDFVSDEDATDSHVRERNLLASRYQECDPEAT